MLEQIEVGDIVDYHSIIGGDITSKGHRVKLVLTTPNSYGYDVAWISRKGACVVREALTLSKDGKEISERQLIRDVRKKIELMGCHCHLYENQLCNECELLRMIDEGLDAIGKER